MGHPSYYGYDFLACGYGFFAGGEDVAHSADLCAYAAELFLEVLVAAVHVIDAVEDGFSVGDESG